MGLFDKVKDKAADVAANAGDMAMQAAETRKQASMEKREEKAARKELASMFSATQKHGALEVDAAHRLVKIKHATTELPKKKSGLGTATAAVMTLGASVAVSAAMKPADFIVSFEDVRGYAVIQDDDAIQGGTIGAAAVGAVLFGGVGAIVGATGRRRKNKKVINTMALRVDLATFDMPCAIVSYISKPVKNDDKEYAKAVSELQSAMSCLDFVLEQQKA